jgi:hypothetical protein
LLPHRSISLIEKKTQKVESLVIIVTNQTSHGIVPDNGQNKSGTREKWRTYANDVVLSIVWVSGVPRPILVVGTHISKCWPFGTPGIEVN